MVTTDEAREALLEHHADAAVMCGASDETLNRDMDALIAAVRAESDEHYHGFIETAENAYADGERNGRAESAQELAALREAAEGLVDALGARVPGLTRQQWKAVDALRTALAATPAERLYPDPRPVVERGGIAATPAEDWMALVPDDPNDRTAELADERAATPAEDGEGRT